MNLLFEANFGSGWITTAPPINWKTDTKVEVMFTSDTPSGSLNNANFIWVGKWAQLITQYLAQGLSGGTGITEGIPFRISVIGSNPLIYIFQGVIDHEAEGALFEVDKVQCPLKRIGSIDWLDTFFEGVTYTLLAQTPFAGFSAYIGPPNDDGSFNNSFKYNYKRVPYLITQETDVPQAIMLILEEFSMGQHLYNAINNTAVLVGQTVGAIGSVPFDIPEIVADVAELIVQIAYDVILVLALVGNVEMLLSNLGIITSWKYAMTATDLFMSAFDYANNQGGNPNVKFSSTIFGVNATAAYNGVYATTPNQGLTLMPRKVIKENASLSKTALAGGVASQGNEQDAPNTYGYYDDNVNKFRKDLGMVFNAKFFCYTTSTGITAAFEEVHHFFNISTTALPNTDKPGYNKNWPGPFTFNWKELCFDYELIYRTDPQEERTTIVYTGTSCGVVTQPKVVNNVLNLLPPPSKYVQLPFALAKRKEYTSVIENVIADIYNFLAGIYNLFAAGYNAVANVINSATSWLTGSNAIATLPSWPYFNVNLLEGYLEVSANSWTVPKIFLGVAGEDYNGAPCWKIAPNNGANNNGIWNNPKVPASTPYRGEGDMSAFAMMNLFHCLNLPIYTPVDRNGNTQPKVNNQWLIYKGKRYPFRPSDFTNVLNNNVINVQIKDPFTDNLIAVYGKFDTLTWDLYNEIIDEAKFRVSYLYNNNLQTYLSIDGN